MQMMQGIQIHSVSLSSINGKIMV